MVSKSGWKLNAAYRTGESSGAMTIEDCYQKTKAAGVSYFSYRNDGGRWCQWGPKDSFDKGTPESHYHSYALEPGGLMHLF